MVSVKDATLIMQLPYQLIDFTLKNEQTKLLNVIAFSLQTGKVLLLTTQHKQVKFQQKCVH